MMIVDEKKVLAVIPARGGSKGIKLKNIKKINGIPLIGYVAKVISGINFIDRTVVSTDNDKIRNISIKLGLDCPFVRPKRLSGNRSSDMPVLSHALKKMEKLDDTIYDIVLMLQPTSPLRTKTILKKAINLLKRKKYDAVWSVSKLDNKFHEKKQLKLNKKGFLTYASSDGKNIIARQMLKDRYIRNGLVYVFTRETIIKEINLPTRTGFISCEGYIPNIDTLEDLKEAEKFFKKKDYK